MGGSTSSAPRKAKRVIKGAGEVGKKKWFESINPLSLIYFDTSHRKTNKSGERFDA
jgi:hypothetical protein